MRHAALLAETAAGDRGVVGEGPIAPASPVSAQQKELGPKVITVLVVDDRSANRARWRSLLEDRGYVVETANNGREALQLYRQLRPDVVLLDLFMAVMNGCDALGLVRQEDPQAKVVAVADAGTRIGADALAEALELGARRSLAKPVEPWQLPAAIHEVPSEDPHSPPRAEMLPHSPHTTGEPPEFHGTR